MMSISIKFCTEVPGKAICLPYVAAILLSKDKFLIWSKIQYLFAGIQCEDKIPMYFPEAFLIAYLVSLQGYILKTL